MLMKTILTILYTDNICNFILTPFSVVVLFVIPMLQILMYKSISY